MEKDMLFRSESSLKASDSKKNAKNKQWYKDYIRRYCVHSGGEGSISKLNGRNKAINYDLANDIINTEDFSHVLQPYGAKVDLKMPARLVNRNITNKRVKAVLGMEQKRPFNYRLVAVNSEATSRIEQEEFNRIKGHVDDMIMAPIRERVTMQYDEALKKRDLTPEEKQEIQKQIQSEIAASTPAETKKYMAREHQDPAEIMGNQVLTDLKKRNDIERKLDKCMHHMLISGYEHMYVGLRAGKTVNEVVNTKYFDHDMNPDHDFTEQGSWARYRMPMSKSDLVLLAGDELTNDELDRLYNFNFASTEGHDDWSFNSVANDGYGTNNYTPYDEDTSHETVWVSHVQFKALKEIGFLYYLDEDGDEQMEMVDANYKVNEERGERLEKEWLPALYEGYQALNDIYFGMKEVEGQFVSLEKLGHEELGYKGVRTDHLNSVPTGFFGRMRPYQYFYNIISYRMELLTAADKGKKIAVNVKLIPESAGMSVDKWTNYFESSPFVFYNPDEEGYDAADLQNLYKVIDLSTTKQISDYIRILEFIDKQCGDAIGLDNSALGDTPASQEVGNTKLQRDAVSNILEPYFSLHEVFKKRVLLATLETAKIEYYLNPPEYLNYVLDDMSREIAKLDSSLLAESRYGLYIENGAKLSKIKEDITALAHAAMQTDKVIFSDILRLMRQDDTRVAEEDLRVSEQAQMEAKAKEQESLHNQQMQQIEATKTSQFEVMDKEHEHKMEEIAAKGEIDLQKQVILSAGFNEDKDIDNDGIPDVVELYKNGRDADIKQQEVDIKRESLEIEKEKLKIEKKENKTIAAKK